MSPDEHFMIHYMQYLSSYHPCLLTFQGFSIIHKSEIELRIFEKNYLKIGEYKVVCIICTTRLLRASETWNLTGKKSVIIQKSWQNVTFVSTLYLNYTA